MEVVVTLKQHSYDIPNNRPLITIESVGRNNPTVNIKCDGKLIVVNGNDLIKAIQKAQI